MTELPKPGPGEPVHSSGDISDGFTKFLIGIAFFTLFVVLWVEVVIAILNYKRTWAHHKDQRSSVEIRSKGRLTSVASASLTTERIGADAHDRTSTRASGKDGCSV